MKINISITLILLLTSFLLVMSCKSKKEMNDPTTLEVSILAELQDGVNAKRIQKELSQFKITDIKPSNRTLNQYIFNVTLDGQSADEFLKVLRTKEYVKSAMIAPSLVEPAQNMPAGKSTKTKPIKQ